MYTANGAEDAASRRLPCRSHERTHALPLPLVLTTLRSVGSLLRALRRPAARDGRRGGEDARARHAPTRSPPAALGCPHAGQAGAAGGVTRAGMASNLSRRDSSAATVVAGTCARCRCTRCPLLTLRLLHVLPPLHRVPLLSTRAFACMLAEAARILAPSREDLVPSREDAPRARPRACERACAP